MVMSNRFTSTTLTEREMDTIRRSLQKMEIILKRNKNKPRTMPVPVYWLQKTVEVGYKTLSETRKARESIQ